MRQMQVDRAAIDNVEIVDVPDGPLSPGQARMGIERLALTANTVTYASAGDLIGYWKFYPTERDGWGQVPAWGFAVVTESAGPLKVGDRYYGFWPIATSIVVTPDRVRDTGFTDAAPHRSSLPQIYNSYSAAPLDENNDLRALLQPLLVTSYLIDDFLADNEFFGAEQVIIGSASSKTGIGLASYLGARDPNGPKIVGLTGTGNVLFCEDLEFYDKVISYDHLTDEIDQAPSVFVDMAGNASVRLALHTHLADNLKYSCAVGMSHWDQNTPIADLPGVKPKMFFAPSWAEKRHKDWGAAELGKRLDASWRDAAKSSSKWLSVTHHNGLDQVPTIWTAITSGEARPDEGTVVVMGG